MTRTPDRATAPLITNPVNYNIQLKPYEFYRLDNKTPVYAINAGAQDVVLVEWVFYAGNNYESKNIVAATANFLLKNGTKSKTALQINEHFEFYGAYLNRSCYNETATITLHCLSKHLKELLPVVAELIAEAVMPQEEIEIYKQNQKQKLTVNLKKADFVANRFIDVALYGEQHPYGKYTTAATFDEVNREELLDFYKQYYTNGKCLIFTAGKLPADIFQQLNNTIGHLNLNNKDVADVMHTAIQAPQKKQQIINDDKGVQAAIRMAINFPNRHHPHFKKVGVLNTVFGGYFGSRLMENIREDKGYTYGIHSYLQNHIEQSAWLVTTEAGRDVATATISEVYKEMQLLRDELIEDDELDLVRNYMIGSILGELDGPFQIIARWKNYILNGLDENYFYESLDTIRTITAKELQELANIYLVDENFYELTVI